MFLSSQSNSAHNIIGSATFQVSDKSEDNQPYSTPDTAISDNDEQPPLNASAVDCHDSSPLFRAIPAERFAIAASQRYNKGYQRGPPSRLADTGYTIPRKRPSSSSGSHASRELDWRAKRYRPLHTGTQMMGEEKQVPAHPYSLKEQKLRYSLRFSRLCSDKEWEVDDLSCVSLGSDGSLSCKVKWQPTTALVSSLEGPLLDRAEKLVKDKFGAEVWEGWVKNHSPMGRRRRRE